jgi:hypothetical protein
MYEDRNKAKGERTPVKNEAVKEEGEGEKPPNPPSPPSSSSYSSSSSPSSSDGSEHSSHKRKTHSKKSSHSHDLPLLNLDVKFYFPTYDGELNADKLYNWVKQIEVYCRVHKIIQDTSKIQLATLFLSGTTLIWWESQKKANLIQHGKIISSWIEFFAILRKKFCPLAYMQTSMIAWKHLRQGKGKNFQAYTQVFKRKALSLGIPLHTLETLLKYIGGMHSYLFHTILIFNPTNIDKVSIQATHFKSNKGKHVVRNVSEDPHEFEK